jgi:aspartate/methionine/tyrosine aminotransferase
LSDLHPSGDFHPTARLRGIEKSMIRQMLDRALPDSINLGLGEPDLPTPEVIRRAAARVIAEEQNGYTSHAGLLSLRELIANDNSHPGVNPEGVIITAGSQEAMYLALMTLVEEGDEVMLPDPGFVAYPTIVRMAGGEPVFYRLPAARDFAFDAEDFKRKLTARTRAVVVISPSNPTGRTLSAADLAMMAGALRESRAFVISDEIYRELYYTEARPASISEHYERSLVIGGLSKSMSMTGWRLGWMCGDEAVIKSALVLHGYVTTCASTISQKAALASWTDEAEGARKAHRRIFQERRDYLLELLRGRLGLRAVTPEGAFYTMVDVGPYGSSIEVADAMLRERVITVPGAAFGSQGESYLRISFCADLPALAEGVRRMGMAVKQISDARY